MASNINAPIIAEKRNGAVDTIPLFINIFKIKIFARYSQKTILRFVRSVITDGGGFPFGKEFYAIADLRFILSAQ